MSSAALRNGMDVLLLALRGDFNRLNGGGIQRYISELYANMLRLRGGRMRIRRREYVPAFSLVGNAIFFAFESMVDSFNDARIIHNLMELPFAKPKWLRRDTVLLSTAHEFAPLTHPELDPDILEEVMTGFLTPSVIRIAAQSLLASDFLIANSTQTMEEAVSLGYSRKRVRVVNLGIDRRFSAEIREKRRSRGKFVAGYIGTIRKRKGIDMIAQASRRVDSREFEFRIYGNAGIFKHDEFVSFMRHDRSITFNGFAPEGRLVDTYDSFDAFVFPSLYEGFGLPILEAKARGLPVILNKSGHIPEEVKRHCFEVGNADEMADVLQRLKANGYNERRRRRAMHEARSFTWRKTALDTLEVYNRVS